MERNGEYRAPQSNGQERSHDAERPIAKETDEAEADGKVYGRRTDLRPGWLLVDIGGHGSNPLATPVSGPPQ
jgi:hypothetical protein